tara:strand:+ start:609 stop:899 length:291 start_codon:yes stop_codon:yes gene_type:complete
MSTAIVYRIIYPNGKSCVGQDRTNSINYFGSASNELIAGDFSWDARQNFTITREVLRSSTDAKRREINAKELEFIRFYRSNDPKFGYNHWPKSTRD